jgi:hypothetical protein
VIAVVLALPLAGAGSGAWPGRVAHADVLQDLGFTFEQVAGTAAAAFPKVEARIVEIQGDVARLAGPQVAQLRVGLELSAYRKGEVFRHPVTTQPLGRAEEEVGTLVVTAVAPDHVTARIALTPEGRRPAEGDGARLTAGRISVAVLPTEGVTLTSGLEDYAVLLMVARFSALLEKTERFLATEPERVLDLARGRALPAPPAAAPTSGAARPPVAATEAPPSSPAEIGRRLGASVVIASRVRIEERTRVLETTWVSSRTGATLLETRTPLVKARFPLRFAWEETPEFQRRVDLDGPVRGLALADLDGDGRQELVVADDRGLTVHRWSGQSLAPVAGATWPAAGSILSVDAADLTGSGRSVVVVVDQVGGGEFVRSSVLELTGGGFRVLHEANGRYLRVIRAGTEPWLVEQAVGIEEPFDSRIRRLVWQAGRFQDGVSLVGPKDVSVYGLALMPLTGGAEPDLVTLTPEDRLVVWAAGGRRAWTSADTYGGSTLLFPYSSPSIERRQDVSNGLILGKILGRLLPVPGQGPGQDLLVFENQTAVGNQLRGLLPRAAPLALTQGRIHRLTWEGAGFRRVWSSRQTEGYIADFAHGDLDGDGELEVVVGVVPRGLDLATLGRPQAHLIFYELPR